MGDGRGPRRPAGPGQPVAHTAQAAAVPPSCETEVRRDQVLTWILDENGFAAPAGWAGPCDGIGQEVDDQLEGDKMLFAVLGTQEAFAHPRLMSVILGRDGSDPYVILVRSDVALGQRLLAQGLNQAIETAPQAERAPVVDY